MAAGQVGYFMSRTSFCPIASTDQSIGEENAGAVTVKACMR